MPPRRASTRLRPVVRACAVRFPRRCLYGRVSGPAAVALDVEFEDVERWTRRSATATVMASPPKILPQALKGSLAITRSERFS